MAKKLHSFKINLPAVVTFPELIAAIVEQFVFMDMMRFVDNPAKESVNANLNKITEEAVQRFFHLCTYEEAIDTSLVNLEWALMDFLQPWGAVYDVIAIQQNIHYNLSKK